MKNLSKKEHKEHKKALEPLIKHLKKDERKLVKKEKKK